MKSLVLKDLYNIWHNAKSMLFILLVLAFIMIPFVGVDAYIIMSGILCSMMVTTTFSFDDNSKWMKYAMVMPVTKKGIVIGKFVVLLIFSAIGAVSGLIIGSIGGVILHKINFGDILTLLLVGVTSLAIAVIIGSMSIPLLFKFGTEKARMLTLVSFLVPAAIGFGIYEILTLFGILITDFSIFIVICCSPLIALAWGLIMYKISYVIFSSKELLY